MFLRKPPDASPQAEFIRIIGANPGNLAILDPDFQQAPRTTIKRACGGNHLLRSVCAAHNPSPLVVINNLKRVSGQ
jgi:hypothetical protein